MDLTFKNLKSGFNNAIDNNVEYFGVLIEMLNQVQIMKMRGIKITMTEYQVNIMECIYLYYHSIVFFYLKGAISLCLTNQKGDFRITESFLFQ